MAPQRRPSRGSEENVGFSAMRKEGFPPKVLNRKMQNIRLKYGAIRTETQAQIPDLHHFANQLFVGVFDGGLHDELIRVLSGALHVDENHVSAPSYCGALERKQRRQKGPFSAAVCAQKWDIFQKTTDLVLWRLLWIQYADWGVEERFDYRSMT
eukprot:scaffold114_cov361-Pinguiococcus_pyrenoidosus.AAC.14